MSHKSRAAIAGTVDAVFVHRFVVVTKDGNKVLADLGPRGADRVSLKAGMHVELEGDVKPSEIKVASISVGGGERLAIDHGPKDAPNHDDRPADPTAALRSVEKAGFRVVDGPRRKAHHFEILGQADGRFVECHVAFDGHIRKEKPVAPGDGKWGDALGTAA